MNPILLRGRPQSIPACALIIEAGGVHLARIILSSERTRIEFNVYVSSTARSIIHLVRFLRSVAAWGGSRIEVKEDPQGSIDYIDIIPPLKTVDAELLTRKIQNAIAAAIEEEQLTRGWGVNKG